LPAIRRPGRADIIRFSKARSRRTTSRQATSSARTHAFLDEIGELPLELQANCCACSKRRYQRVGETQSRVSNARVIAAPIATCARIRNGRFRADLYHRLSFSRSRAALARTG